MALSTQWASAWKRSLKCSCRSITMRTSRPATTSRISRWTQPLLSPAAPPPRSRAAMPLHCTQTLIVWMVHGQVSKPRYIAGRPIVWRGLAHARKEGHHAQVDDDATAETRPMPRCCSAPCAKFGQYSRKPFRGLGQPGCVGERSGG